MTSVAYALAGWVAGLALGLYPFVRAYRGLSNFERAWLRQRPVAAITPDPAWQRSGR